MVNFISFAHVTDRNLYPSGIFTTCHLEGGFIAFVPFLYRIEQLLLVWLLLFYRSSGCSSDRFGIGKVLLLDSTCWPAMRGFTQVATLWAQSHKDLFVARHYSTQPFRQEYFPIFSSETAGLYKFPTESKKKDEGSCSDFFHDDKFLLCCWIFWEFLWKRV